ncbi:MAG: type II secretion system F family protein [Vulcanimicrobiota bacterium]
MNTRDAASFCRTLGMMYRAGLPIHRSLTVLGQREAVAYLMRGEPLWRSLQRARVLDRVPIQMIRLGETVGNLPQVLDRLTEFLDCLNRARGRILSALAYPAMVLLVCLAVLAWLPGFLFRPVLEFLANTGGELPTATRLALFLCAALRNPLLWLGAAVLLGLTYRAFKNRQAPLDPGWEQRLLRLPAAGRGWRNLVALRFGRGLEGVLASGAPLMTGLSLCAEASGSGLFQSQVRSLIEDMRNGHSLANALERLDLLPLAYRRALKVGAETGRLEQMLPSLNTMAEEEFELLLESLVTLLEPLVMLLLGGLVALMIAATLSPFLELMRSVL